MPPENHEDSRSTQAAEAPSATRHPRIRKWAPVLGLIVGLVLLLLSVSVHQAKALSEEKRDGVACMMQMKQLVAAIGLAADRQEHRFPGSNWCDMVAGIMGRPAALALLCPRAIPGERCSYALNAELLGLQRARVGAPAETVLLFESDAGWNATGEANLLVSVPRHRKSIGVAFADGHVEMCNPARIAQLRWKP